MSSNSAPSIESTTGSRTFRPRHYLICRPDHFQVNYSINPWMNPVEPVDTKLAVTQWELKGGGSVTCRTLEIRPARGASRPAARSGA